MRCLKGLGCLFVCYLIDSVACANLWDFSRHVPVTEQLQNRATDNSLRQAGASSPRQLIVSPLQSVTVQCHEAKMVIVVHRDLFETGHLIEAADLYLAPQACHYTSVSASDLVIFEVEFHECGSNLQTTADSLFYHTSLYYNPGPASNPVIVRNSPVEIPIECRYPRKDNVSSDGIQRTWSPSASTKSVEGRLHFSLRLMTDDWSAERESTQYQLGDYLHIQADIDREGHLPLRLFVDSCVASQTPERDSIPHYAILDFHGCLVDGRAHDVASVFRIPRPQQETLQFTIETFRFAGDTRNLIYISCHLKVTAADKEPDLLNKACSFNSQRNIWLPVEGSKDICNCCETGNCGSSTGWPSTINLSNHHTSRQKQMPSGSAIIDLSKGKVDADLVVGPLLILDAPWDHQKGEVGTKETMVAEGESHVIETESESTVGHQFFLKADERLRWLLDSDETVMTTTDNRSHIVYDNVAAKLTSDAEGNSGELAAPVEVAKMPLQGTASEKGTVLERIQMTGAGILMLALFSCIF
ncbi:zona pellucida sperm-binding protein 3-like [Rhineura floridana]|uniref:zona pellucida sperm-binding protein 3-like n=1 Tax=Rhineura floridana TaxID=261503 RepID=UPI002AC86D08|nr:zona pellucida sperm-binding protein 3-like [Rhineura floridana]